VFRLRDQVVLVTLMERGARDAQTAFGLAVILSRTRIRCAGIARSSTPTRMRSEWLGTGICAMTAPLTGTKDRRRFALSSVSERQRLAFTQIFRGHRENARPCFRFADIAGPHRLLNASMSACPIVTFWVHACRRRRVGSA